MSEPELDDEAALARAVDPHHHSWCFGCGADNPIGLHLPWDAVEPAGRPERYAAGLVLDARHQGGPGLAHGGIVSAALDEAMGILAQHVAFPSVTARIEVRYRRPVPTGRQLRLEARLERVAGKQVTIAARLRDGEGVLAEGRAVFLQVPLRHFLQTPEGLAQREEVRRRLKQR